MKAAVFYGPGDLRIEEKSIPSIGKDEVLIKVKYCAICGTDVRIYYNGQSNVIPPRIIGHEISGVIEEVGSDVDNYVKGEKVLLAPMIACGKCGYCLTGNSNMCENQTIIGYQIDGGFAEYVKVPAKAVNGGNIIKLDDDADLLSLSIAEPLSCVINGHKYLNIGLGESVLIIGAGPIGAMHASLAKAKGASKVILADIQDDRLKLAAQSGANYIINSNKEDLLNKVKEITRRQGVDIAIAACSAPVAQQQAIEAVKKCGKVSFFAGLPKDKSINPINTNRAHYDEISIFGAFGSTISQHIIAKNLLDNNIVNASKLITEVIPLDDIIEGIKMVKNGKGLKTVVKM
ncbi:zinc-dependent dehydrogenase [Tepidimicrobium xylanilyticum]|uniref:zinc-dependent dehydrogenase n=1 Tax=Tepidimicrobium xylanilyticum TaxID=1123352 RepID=UPI002656B703|nr:zinc-dependent dehydrogenase [Tepidimicrobium xylanilyticum]GMG95429.1 alcohol dehydrogenase [Tepidimicrobium xylanilyticum]